MEAVPRPSACHGRVSAPPRPRVSASATPSGHGNSSWRGRRCSGSPLAGSSAQFDVWRDAGLWLVLIPLAVAPLFFRRGLVAVLALGVLAAAPGRADASTWDDLWHRRDQQGQAALASGDAAAAAGLFEDPAWQAAATYESGTYDQATTKYASLGGTENRYNLGNSLAKSGKLEDAVKQYDEVLKQEPQHADARFNRDLVQRLLDEQRRQQQENQQKQQSRDQQAEQQNGDGTPQQHDASSQQADAQPKDQNGAQGAGEEQDPAQQPEQNAGSAEQPGRDESEEQQPSAQQTGDGQQPKQDETASSAPTGDQQQQQQQQAKHGSAGEDASDEPQDQAAAARNEAAQRDQALARDLDQQLAADGASENDDQPQDENAPRGSGSSTAKKPLTEQEQAREQALRNIPDDPAGLLRAKIRRQYAEKRYSRQEASPSW